MGYFTKILLTDLYVIVRFGFIVRRRRLFLVCEFFNPRSFYNFNGVYTRFFEIEVDERFVCDHLVGEDQLAKRVYFDGGAGEVRGRFEIEDVAFCGEHLDARTGFIVGLNKLRAGDQDDKKDKSFKRFHF